MIRVKKEINGGWYILGKRCRWASYREAVSYICDLCQLQSTLRYESAYHKKKKTFDKKSGSGIKKAEDMCIYKVSQV
jgi:hypothetical protein